MRARRSRPQPGLGGRYRLDGIVGRGSLSDVFRAWDRERNRPVAVKWVREGIDPSLYPLWRADSDELRRLDHPGLVRERDHGTENGRPYLVMDLAGSSTLRALREEKALAPHDVASAARQLAGTLRYVHDNDVVHRYVTLDKILVERASLIGDPRFWLDCGPWVPNALPPSCALAPAPRHGEESSVAGDI